MSSHKNNSLKAVAVVLFAALIAITSVAPASAIEKDEGGNARGTISDAVVDALSAGDVNGAIIAMREEPSSPKLLYLTRELTRINNFPSAPKPDKSSAHKTYQNLAIAYHNVYLFLKSRGVDKKTFLKEAHRYYHKARSAGTTLHKADCDLLDAALTAASGNIEKARKQFSRIDEDALRGDFDSMEYLAAYHAATGDAPAAITALEAVHSLNPDATVTWLAIGDDFHGIADDQGFKELLVTWKATEVSKRLTLQVPKGSKPRLEVSDETGLFRPQKSMPHYDLKKKKKGETKISHGRKEHGKKDGKNSKKAPAGKKQGAKKPHHKR
ncbi:MAG: hypothetical protein V2A66_03075 [Pseudomonadota bacterium]